MPAPKGHPKWGGRAKGTPNKRTQELMEICKSEDIDVFRAMIVIAKAEGDSRIRFGMLTDIAKYLYPMRKAVDENGAADAGFVGAEPVSEERTLSMVMAARGKK